ncbi:hypothetical protein LMG7974_01594 [Campylobacter majalis]|uniref:Uncharacterized protein n=1 Tax=Campylobacter majalis TaxID=2790656 RepID=A0ABN7KAK5_9BACT|nr:hypothetical protein [Campylobacter majalis]CAD7289517.1 hypothetical protein LMG7974_01594 [Campylobacter majalis]
MLKLNIYGVNFLEQNINSISKRGVFDALKIFWNGDDRSYIDYLESIGIDYFHNLSNLYSLNQNLNEDIEKLKYAISKQNTGNFDFKAVSLFTNKNLPPIQDSQYLSLTIDLREIQDRSKIDDIKDVFLTTPSVSLVDFKEIGENSLTLIFHRRGALKYCDEYVLNMSKENIQLLENFKTAKDNNFILTRFLLDMSHKLKELGVDEVFGYTYEQGSQTKEISKSIDEIISWGGLSMIEKEQRKALERQNDDILKNAKEIAKSEIKEERDSKRDSLPKDSTIQILQTEKQPPKVFNLASMAEVVKTTTDNNTREETPKINIDKIIEDSFTLYTQKEFEKTKMRLEKAQSDAKEAYVDLKNNLNNGLSINEALKNITQKYRNEDTINFASLLFTKDILNLKIKEQEINELKNELSISKKAENELLEQITKREETISKQKGTIQLKVNEMTQLREDFEKELKVLREADNKLQILNKYSEEQEQIIADLDNDNNDLNEQLQAEKQNNTSLRAKSEYLQNIIKEKSDRITILEQEVKDGYKDKIEIERLKTNLEIQVQKSELLEQEAKKVFLAENQIFKLELENKSLKEREKILQDQIDFLKTQLDKQQNSPVSDDHQKQKQQRSKDILS